jgi:hypothetical protein
MLAWGALLGTLMLKPVRTDSQGFTSDKGESCSLSLHPSPWPVDEGTHRLGMMPLPKNQVPNRIGREAPAA